MPQCSLRAGGEASFCLQINMLEYDTHSDSKTSVAAYQSSAKNKEISSSLTRKQLHWSIWGQLASSQTQKFNLSIVSSSQTDQEHQWSGLIVHRKYRNNSLLINPSANVVINLVDVWKKRKQLAETYSIIQKFGGQFGFNYLFMN